eukprot:CAMPEP_0170334246 /NCGR_PEP_ID=MMETSP0116_2-20130129/68154_1 /TAXON_ID=400756 /ORGANISM="Durinskia baltica, Strain CSIRO CS-38" /LENGTH=233 /DNA_ID=CAMNT_0010587611 /DNA_START=75 /DNA_END=775 /DNA_ORIENTATION=+
MVKFGKQIKRLADENQLNHCIAYDVLKKAISVVAASEEGALPIGGSGRPPDSRFHCLLQHELAKVNRFFALQVRTNLDALRDAQAIASKAAPLSEETLLDLEHRLDMAAEQLISIEHFRRLNFTGFRKIVKKFDKRPVGSNAGSLSSWFLPRRAPPPPQWPGEGCRLRDTGAHGGQHDEDLLAAAARADAALCTLVKRFEILMPSAPLSQEARPKAGVDYAAQMRQLLRGLGT